MRERRLQEYRSIRARSQATFLVAIIDSGMAIVHSRHWMLAGNGLVFDAADRFRLSHGNARSALIR